jgi:hypothetical protein
MWSSASPGQQLISFFETSNSESEIYSLD